MKQFKYGSVHPTPKAGGVSPIVAGLIRGIIAAVITGLIAYFTAVPGVGISEEQARIVSILAFLSPPRTLVSYGTSDQNRASNGIAIAGDATISALAQIENRSAEKVARQFTKDAMQVSPARTPVPG